MRGATIHLKIMGSGSGIPTMDHWGSSAALICNGSTYLFDIGGPVGTMALTDEVARFYGAERTEGQIRRDRERYLDIYSIPAIFISHLHADHLSGLPMFIQTASLWQKRDEAYRFPNGNRLEVFMPKMGVSIMREYLELIGLGQPRYDLCITPIEEGNLYRDSNITISAQHNSHRLGSSFSFSARGQGRRILYTGDIALKDITGTPLLSRPLDLLVVECAHFTPGDLFDVLRGKPIKKIVISHISPGLYGKVEEIQQIGREMFGESVIVARDAMEVEI
ncbi:MAG: MBL fold metallo-hydrolase [Theionarchaea archaeon]|nr:MBL fold metallo-hydrolase [Theionarchaea archaeon]